MNAPNSPTLNFQHVVAQIASLASLPYQERYIVNGTKDEYLLSSELLEDVSSLRYSFDRAENRSVLTDAQRVSLGALIQLIDEVYKYLPEWKSHAQTAEIASDSTWQTIRVAANDTLKEFGLDADHLSIEDIDRLY
jgi:hypothetical protein